MTQCCAAAKQPQLTNITKRIALVGNPNCGKTTLFNLLTGAKQHVGNWPGVTVERKSGYFSVDNARIEVIDLPGVYALTRYDQGSVDARIACEYILQEQPDVIVNILDASNLERHLYLTMQLLALDVPMIIALNMMDIARSKAIAIDVAGLARQLGCPVIAITAHKGEGVRILKQQILATHCIKKNAHAEIYAAPVLKAIQQICVLLQKEKSFATCSQPFVAMNLLEEQTSIQHFSDQLYAEVLQQKTLLQQELQEDPDILLAEMRYQYIQTLLDRYVATSTANKISWTQRIDHVILNRVLGLPIFLGVMYLLFFFAINIGGAFQDFFDISSQTIFVDGFAHLLSQLAMPTWLIAILANGLGKGLNTTLTFIPVIGSMFLFLALLEDSGYMARAAFVIDRFMRFLGLPGKAFVPMIIGFGCNVPAVMAARALENKRDRILTIMMSPFMSCGARLAIYAVFTAAFFPHGAQNVVFALYLIGIAIAILTGFLLRQTALKGEPAPLVMELPLYHVPQLKTVMLHAWQRLRGFVFRAGKLIVPICVLLGTLNALNIDGSINTGDADTHSILSLIGQWVTPIFAPMGIHADNWPATVGLVTGVLAKEVVVGTLNTLYSQLGHLTVANGLGDFHFWGSLKTALISIPENFSQLGSAFSNPVLAQAPIDTLNKNVYGLMYQKFDGQIGAFAYLLFVLLYFPCVSTLAVMLKELHRGWAIFSAFWMTGVAYGVAVIFYQLAKWSSHPFSSALWVFGILGVFGLTIAYIQTQTRLGYAA